MAHSPVNSQLETTLSQSVVLGQPVTRASVSQVLDEMVAFAKAKIASYTCVASVHSLVEGFLNPFHHNVLCQAHIVTPDGRPIGLAMTSLSNQYQEQVAGLDLLTGLLKRCEEEHLSVYVFGGDVEALRAFELIAMQRHPGLKLLGTHSPPFSSVETLVSETYVEMLKAASPDVVLVSLGCPKQEAWMYHMVVKYAACYVGIGYALSVYAGVAKRAPEWMRRGCLEWLYRLSEKPAQLLLRYVGSNTTFLMWFIPKLILHKLAQVLK